MQTNSTITIFNRRLDASGNDVLIPTVSDRASWFYGQGSSKGQYGDNEDSYSVRIPFDADASGKEYIDACQWKNLTDVSGYWTIQKDDIVVRGEMSGSVTDQTEIMSATDDCFLVNSFANNTIRGSDAVKHWRIGGV